MTRGRAATYRSMSASRRSISLAEGPLGVVHCRPQMSAFRWLSLGVSFPAVNSRGRPALADPKEPVATFCSTDAPTLEALVR